METELVFCLKLPDGTYSRGMPENDLLQEMEQAGRTGDVYAYLPQYYGTVKGVFELVQGTENSTANDTAQPQAPKSNGTMPKTARRTKRAVKANKGKRSASVLSLDGKDSQT